MTLLAERSGRLLEHASNDVPRGMTVRDRTRLTVRAVCPHTAAVAAIVGQADSKGETYSVGAA